MDKLRSTIKQFVRDWSAEVQYTYMPSQFPPTDQLEYSRVGERRAGAGLCTNERGLIEPFLRYTSSREVCLFTLLSNLV